MLNETVKLTVLIIINLVPLGGDDGRFNIMFPLVLSIIRVPVEVASNVCGEVVPVIEKGVRTLFLLIFNVPDVVILPGPIVTAPVDVENEPFEEEKLTLPDVIFMPLAPLILPPIKIFPPIPEPPVTIKAPVVVEDDDVDEVIDIAVFVVNDVPVNDIAPEVLVRFKAPVVNVKPLDTVNKPDNVSPPAMVCADPNVLIIKSAEPPASGIVYVLEASGMGVGDVIVIVFVVPKII